MGADQRHRRNELRELTEPSLQVVVTAHAEESQAVAAVEHAALEPLVLATHVDIADIVLASPVDALVTHEHHHRASPFPAR